MRNTTRLSRAVNAVLQAANLVNDYLVLPQLLVQLVSTVRVKVVNSSFCLRPFSPFNLT